MERFIQRLVQFEPILGMSTLGIILQVPVVSMRSILELMGGRQVSNEEDSEAMRSFIVRCWNSDLCFFFLTCQMS
jgi:hypothetical protein